MHDLVEFLSTTSLRLERVLAAKPERVWAHLVDPAKRSRWFCAGDALTGAGQRFELHFNHYRITEEPPPAKYARFDGSQPDLVSKGQVLTFEPPRRLRFAWGEEEGSTSLVTFELTPEGAHTRVVITHEQLPNREELIDVGAGWNAHLGVLEDELANRKHRGFWSDHERFVAQLEKSAPRAD